MTNLDSIQIAAGMVDLCSVVLTAAQVKTLGLEDVKVGNVISYQGQLYSVRSRHSSWDIELGLRFAFHFAPYESHLHIASPLPKPLDNVKRPY